MNVIRARYIHGVVIRKTRGIAMFSIRHSSSRGILIQVTLALLCAGISQANQDVVIGDSPSQYKALDQKMLEKDLARFKNQGVSSSDMLRQSARARGLLVIESQQAPSASRHRPNPPPRLIAAPTRPQNAGEPSTAFLHKVKAEYLCENGPDGKCAFYAPAGTGIHIEVTDDGYGFTDEERTRVFSLLGQIPRDHLKGIKTIRLRAKSDKNENPEVSDGELVVYANSSAKDKSASFLTSALGSAIGEHVYQSVLTDDEKQEWTGFLGDVWKASAASLFGSTYTNYLHGSQGRIDFTAQNATLNGASNWAQQHGIDSFQAKANPEAFQQMMFVAYRFVNKENSTIRFVESNKSGFLEAKDRKIVALDNENICYGKLCFNVPIEENKVHGYFQKPPPPGPNGLLHLITYANWDPPVPLPTPPLYRAKLTIVVTPQP